MEKQYMMKCKPSNIAYIGPVVGVSFPEAKNNFEKVMLQFKESEENTMYVELQHDIGNKYDNSAVAVYAWINNGEKLRIGFIPAKNGENSKLLAIGLKNLSVAVTRINEHEGKPVGLTISIEPIEKLGDE